MKLIVDRIEEDFAVCEVEDGTFRDISLSELPSETKEGTVLIFSDGEYFVDHIAQGERRAKLFALQDSIFDE